MVSKSWPWLPGMLSNVFNNKPPGWLNRTQAQRFIKALIETEPA